MRTLLGAQRWRTAGPSFAFALTGVAVAVLRGIGPSGPAVQGITEMFGVVTLVAIPIGMYLHQPGRRAPWTAMTAALALFLLEVGLRGPGDRIQRPQAGSLAPLLVALAAYLVMAVSLTMLARSPDREDRGKVDIVVDGIIAMMATFPVAWMYMIEPVLSRHGVPLPVRMLVASFPSLDVYLVMIAFRVGFDHRSRRATSGRFLLASVLLMLVGDVLYTLADVVNLVPVPLALVYMPYILAATAFGAAALHPSMRQLSLTRRRQVHGSWSVPTRGRLAIVALALVSPSLMLLNPRSVISGDRLVVGIVGTLTAAAATWRVFRALRNSASSEARLAHQATHDDLTGLPNRVLVEQWVSGMLDEPGLHRSGIAVAFLDIDRFKLVNDTFGHSHGDMLLMEVAQRIEAATSPKDVIARIGGDEFVIVLESVSSIEQARRRAERIRQAFDGPFTLGESEVFVTASLGLSVSDPSEHPGDAEMLIRDADTAMYQAKEAGRDAVAVFDTSMRERIADRLLLEHDLRLALEREEFRLAYQPVVSLSGSTRRVIGFEALLRWDTPTRGLVPPGMFISIAEDSGLIVEIGDWVVHEACRQLAQWRQLAGLEDLYVAVNVSALQLKKASLLPRVRGALAQSGLPTDALCIELTESLLMESPAEGTALLAQLKELGVRLALDDFGTGYSSLAYLQQFPVDYVKIDQSFINGLSRHDSSDETLVAAIVSMARALGATTIAEGVEEAEQEARLLAIGADCAQGYYYARPMPADQVVEAVRALTPHRGLRLVSGDAAASRGVR